MSLIPVVLDELNQQYSSIFDQHFGMGISTRDLNNLVHNNIQPLRVGYLRPWRLLNSTDSGLSNISYDKDGFKVTLDVQQFKPEELKVKVVNNFIVIEGNHKERNDEHGFVSRQFTRRYRLPKDVDVNALTSSLSSDGVLQLNAPRLALAEISIPIKVTEQPNDIPPEVAERKDSKAVEEKGAKEAVKIEMQKPIKTFEETFFKEPAKASEEKATKVTPPKKEVKAPLEKRDSKETEKRELRDTGRSSEKKMRK